nr:uncharacterized protein LOC114823300 [Malus domestica]
MTTGVGGENTDRDTEKYLQLTPLRIECITSLVSFNSSLDMFSMERPIAADASNIARLRDKKFQEKKMNHPNNHANDIANPDDNANLDEIVKNDHTPLWKYVKTYKGSYSRVRFHLLKMAGNGVAPCSKVTDENLAEMKKLIRECEYKLKSSAPKNVSLPNTGSFCYDQPEVNLDPKKRKGTSRPLSKAFNKEARDQCDAEVARMVCSTRLQCTKNYFSATRKESHIKQCLQPIKRTWSTKGVSLCSDGWTDAQRRPLINIMATCESGPMFLRAINCEGEYKDKYCIANFLTEAIKEIGHENVVQVITNNAPVCRVAELLIEAHYPHIFWTPCVVHTLNLALKSICSPKQTDVSYDDCNWISTIASDVWSIKFFIMNHSMRLSMFNEHCKLKLLSIAETRFASTLVMLRRFKEVKEGLQQMVISPNWALYKEDDLVKAMTVKQKILDEYFWEKIDYILFFTAPIYEVIRMADTDKPCLHLVYEWWDAMIEKVKAAIYRNERKALHEKSSFF